MMRGADRQPSDRSMARWSPARPPVRCPFLFNDCIKVLRTIRTKYPKAWSRYGYIDAFNPTKNWYNTDVIGIDLGITLLMAENHRTSFVWNNFMQNGEMKNAMRLAGFKINS